MTREDEGMWKLLSFKLGITKPFNRGLDDRNDRFFKGKRSREDKDYEELMASPIKFRCLCKLRRRIKKWTMDKWLT